MTALPNRPAPAVHRDLAWALKQQATRAGEGAPSVRGSDWRLATVTAVNADGTVAVDGIPAVRCMPTYTLPAIDDVIVIDQSSSGNWLAWGRTATTAQTWTTLALASGFQNPGHGHTPAYLREGRRIWLRGRIGPTSGSIADGATLLTLPAAIQPGVSMSWAVTRDSGTYPAVLRLEITTTGTIRTFQATNLPTWVSLDGISYTI
ncbi:hypothetical protein TU94_28470 [Streptomyces cyaneogriseus subsp. noncyanogenus]|uniref:Uncharacterized protein n=1 Tax=Streptomyces cyaneogriseus subsp. noncyanogenus TaxID=477245 RepID=A0A0C5GJW4_9ACTN|nr:hypothetical protein [Streptomyces cyaneogriseus]AJP04796.1 hypothetical protein TU94_28470 [Streptomyces cyaneogriseus subsp. noncyanogenus]